MPDWRREGRASLVCRSDTIRVRAVPKAKDRLHQNEPIKAVRQKGGNRSKVRIVACREVPDPSRVLGNASPLVPPLSVRWVWRGGDRENFLDCGGVPHATSSLRVVDPAQ